MNLNFDNIISTTIDAYQSSFADAYTKENKLLKILKGQGNKAKDDGGVRILENLEYAGSADAIRYTGAKEWNLVSNKFLTAAEYGRKQMAVPLVFVGSEMLANTSKEKMIDLAQTRIENGRKTLSNTLGADVYSDGSESDQIIGLEKLVSETPNTGIVGGIDAATNTQWRNIAIKDKDLNESDVSKATTDMYTRTRRNGDAIKHFMANNYAWTNMYNSLGEKQRFTNTSGKEGFDPDTLAVMGSIPFHLENEIKEPTNHKGKIFGLNTDYIKLRVHKDRDAVVGEKRMNAGQDAYIRPILWAGAMTCSNRKFQAIAVSK